VPRLLVCTTVVGAAAELVALPCSYAVVVTSSYADGALCTVFVLACRVFAMQLPAVSTIHRDEPKGVGIRGAGVVGEVTDVARAAGGARNFG
jgi:hypothetical protein